MKYIPIYRKAYRKARYQRMLERHTIHIDMSDCLVKSTKINEKEIN